LWAHTDYEEKSTSDETTQTPQYQQKNDPPY
jgi:hypothetical protein